MGKGRGWGLWSPQDMQRGPPLSSKQEGGPVLQMSCSFPKKGQDSKICMCCPGYFNLVWPNKILPGPDTAVGCHCHFCFGVNLTCHLYGKSAPATPLGGSPSSESARSSDPTAEARLPQIQAPAHRASAPWPTLAAIPITLCKTQNLAKTHSLPEVSRAVLSIQPGKRSLSCF